MRKILAMTALAAAFALPMVVGSTDANASCQGRKNTGTLIGGVGGALLGNAISHGGGRTGGACSTRPVTCPVRALALTTRWLCGLRTTQVLAQG